MPTGFTSPTSVPCLIATAVNTVEIRQRALEQTAPGQVRVKFDYSMISTGTELHRIQATHTANRPFPTMTGYVAIGQVVGLGDNVTAFKIGQRVLCGTAHLAMIDTDPARCTPVPDEIRSQDAVCTVLINVAMYGIRGAQIRLGDSIAIFGQGVIGCFATHLAKLSGACPVIAIDPVPLRREIARRMGADVTLDAMAEHIPARMKELTNGVGVDTAIEATGTPRVAASLPALVRPEGRIVILGGVHGKVELDLYTHFQKSNLTLIATGSPAHRDWPYDMDGNQAAILRMMQAGMIRPGPMITHCVPYTEGPRMYRMLMEEKDKASGVVFDWTQVSEEK